MMEIEEVSYFTKPYTFLRSCEWNCLQIERLDHDSCVLLVHQVRNRQWFVSLSSTFCSSQFSFIHVSTVSVVDPSGCAVQGICLSPLACWYCGFESHRVHGYLSVVRNVLSDRRLCDKLITHPEEWCVVVCDLETSWVRSPWPIGDCCGKIKQANDTGQKMETSHSFIRALTLVSALNIVHVIWTVAVCLLTFITNCALMSVHVGDIVRTMVRSVEV